MQFVHKLVGLVAFRVVLIFWNRGSEDVFSHCLAEGLSRKMIKFQNFVVKEVRRLFK